MAIKIRSILTRELQHTDAAVPQIIEIDNTDMIHFRYHGKRTRYSISLHTVKTLAMIKFIYDEYERKMDLYKTKKAAGYKGLRKPRKPNVFSMFHKMYREALTIKPRS